MFGLSSDSPGRLLAGSFEVWYSLVFAASSASAKQ